MTRKLLLIAFTRLIRPWGAPTDAQRALPGA